MRGDIYAATLSRLVRYFIDIFIRNLHVMQEWGYVILCNLSYNAILTSMDEPISPLDYSQEHSIFFPANVKRKIFIKELNLYLLVVTRCAAITPMNE